MLPKNAPRPLTTIDIYSTHSWKKSLQMTMIEITVKARKMGEGKSHQSAMPPHPQAWRIKALFVPTFSGIPLASRSSHLLLERKPLAN